MWEKINDKLDAENFSGTARMDEVLPLVLEFLKCGVWWCHDSPYKTIMVIERKSRLNKYMSFWEAFNYVIRQTRVEFMKKLAMTVLKAESSDNEVESDAE